MHTRSVRPKTQWAYENGVEWHCIEPGKPIENACIESFNAHFRDQCLNDNWFTTLADARQTIEQWRQDYKSTAVRTARLAIGRLRSSSRWQRSRALEKMAIQLPWKTLRVYYCPTAPATVKSNCPTHRDSHCDWTKNAG